MYYVMLIARRLSDENISKLNIFQLHTKNSFALQNRYKNTIQNCLQIDNRRIFNYYLHDAR